MNRQYLEAIRSNSCYPTFRGVVQVFTLLGYLIAVFVVVAGFMSGQSGAMFFGIAGAVITVILVHVGKEMSLMLADIADATIDSSAGAVSGSPVNFAAPAVVPQSSVTAEEDDASAMERYGITYAGEQYHFQNHRYDRLSDAISYAKHQASTS